MTTIFVIVFAFLVVAGLTWLNKIQNRQPVTPQTSRRFTAIVLTVTTILALVTFLAIA